MTRREDAATMPQTPQEEDFTETDYIEDTKMHIAMVQMHLNRFILELKWRGQEHDRSKLQSPEKDIFQEGTPKVYGCKFGSLEYEQHKERVRPALDHHYAHNRHHPEHFEKGIDDMNLVDVLEMFVDWIASSKKYGSDIQEVLRINQERFEISPQLHSIFVNTVTMLQENSRK